MADIEEYYDDCVNVNPTAEARGNANSATDASNTASGLTVRSRLHIADTESLYDTVIDVGSNEDVEDNQASTQNTNVKSISTRKACFIGFSIGFILALTIMATYFVITHFKANSFVDESLTSDFSSSKTPEGLTSTTEKANSFIDETLTSDFPSSKTPVVSTSAIEKGQCQPNWQHFSNYCYYFNHIARVAYSMAKTACQDMNANLTSIHSQGEQDFIAEHVIDSIPENKYFAYWIGGNNSGSVGFGGVDWVDGTSSQFTNWHPEEPFNEDQDCVGMLPKDGKWRDQYCTNEQPFVCKKSDTVLVK